jgi:hypothetical protein
MPECQSGLLFQARPKIDPDKDQLVQFGPESLVHYTPELVVQYGPEYSIA